MTRKEEILNNNVHVVRGYAKKEVPAKNGLAAPKELAEVKETLFNASTLHLVDDFTKLEKEYPKNDVLPVKVSLDMVVMERKYFAELLELLEAASRQTVQLKDIQHN